MDFLDRHPLERGTEEAQRALHTLSALLAAFPGDMSPTLQVHLGGREGAGKAREAGRQHVR